MNAYVIGYGDFDDASDLGRLFREDAGGLTSWGISQRGDGPGDFLLYLIGVEPAFKPKVYAMLGEALRDPSPTVRGLALMHMPGFGSGAFVEPLRDALAAEPSAFLGVPDPWFPGHTLLRAWFTALAANSVYDSMLTASALAVAEPYLALPEAGPDVTALVASLGGDAVLARLPAIAEHGHAENLVDLLEPSQLQPAADALRGASLEARKQFAKAMRKPALKRLGEAGWRAIAASLGVDPGRH